MSRSRRSPGSVVLLLSLAALVGASMPAGATHLPDHRFLVLGFVTDADGRPVAGARVVVTRLKTGLEYPTTTERDGFYLVVLHLHDENLGEALGVDAKGVKGEVRARFERQRQEGRAGHARRRARRPPGGESIGLRRDAPRVSEPLASAALIA